ncbi:uncharacterized protein METZ01_LOCUS209864 [marine metagenome]|uniref:Uncharacterized protein n=1 Tax=marine metagenome TaxID=408172 RepID=A0A382F203_9ZZZZ
MATRLEQLERLAEKKPDDNFVQYAIALEYVSVQRFEEAAEILEASMRRDRSYVAAFHQAARTYEQLEQIDDARRCYEQGVTVATEQGDAHARSEMEEALRILE